LDAAPANHRVKLVSILLSFSVCGSC
jgi:hypothetical protein